MATASSFDGNKVPPPGSSQVDADLIRMIENRVRSRCVTSLFREDLWRDCLASSNPMVAAGGNVYRASNDLAELRVSDARRRTKEAAALLEAADIDQSPLIAWWTFNLGGDAADESLKLEEAYRLFTKAADLAERSGLAESWMRSKVNQVYVLKQSGRASELIERLRALVAMETFGPLSELRAVIIADVLAWIGQPALSVQTRSRAGDLFVLPAPWTAAEAHLGEDNLAAAEAILQPDLIGAAMPRHAEPQVHATRLLLAIELRIKQAEIEKAVALADSAARFLSTRDSASHNNVLRLHLARICLMRRDPLGALGELSHVDDERAPTDQRLEVALIYSEANRELERWADAIHWQQAQIERSKQRSLGALAQAEIIDILVSSEVASNVSGPVEKRLSRLREALVEREAMTSLVAKDLRGPIFSLELATNLAESGPSDRVTELLGASQTTLELAISQLTDLDFLESFEASVPAEEHAMQDIVAAAAKLAGPVMRGGMIELAPKTARHGPTVIGHGSLLTRVVAYAIVDVARHLPRGTAIQLAVTEHLDTITITIQTTGGTDAAAPGGIEAGARTSSRRERFVLNRIVQLCGGRLLDSSTSDRDRLVRLTLPGA